MGKDIFNKQTFRKMEKMTTTQATVKPDEAQGNGKSTVIIDKARVLGTFFGYSASVFSVVGKIIEAAMSGGKVEPKKVGEEIRSAYVSACKYNKTLVYRFGSAVPDDFKEYFGTESQTFRPDIIFDAKKNKERNDFKEVVKSLEDTDQFGNKELYPGDNVRIVLLFDAEDDAMAGRIHKGLQSHIENFDELFAVYLNSN